MVACSPDVKGHDDDAGSKRSVGGGSTSSDDSPKSVPGWPGLGNREETEAEAAARLGLVDNDAPSGYQQASDAAGCLGSPKIGSSGSALQQHSNAAVPGLNSTSDDNGNDGGIGSNSDTVSIGADQVSCADFWPSNYPWLLLGTAAAAAIAVYWCSSGMFKSRKD